MANGQDNTLSVPRGEHGMSQPGPEIALLSHGSKTYSKATVFNTPWAGEDLDQYESEIHIKIAAAYQWGRDEPFNNFYLSMFYAFIVFLEQSFLLYDRTDL